MSLIDSLDTAAAEMDALRAFEVELTRTPNEALKVLGPARDPIRMHAALAILLRAERFAEAVQRCESAVVHEKWVDLATYAWAALGEFANAKAMIARADESPDLIVVRRTRVAFADGALLWLRKARVGDDSLLAPRNWESPDIELAATVLTLLEPVLSLVNANRSIKGEIQLSGVICGLYCSYITGEQRVTDQLAGWLFRHAPIPPVVAELCLRGITSPPTNLVARLRAEHLDEFLPHYLAALADRDLFDRPNEAFDSFIALLAGASADEDRRLLTFAIIETVGQCDPGKIDVAVGELEKLQTAGRRIGLLRVLRHVAAGDLRAAQAELETNRDESDSVWWQASAQIAEKLGDEEGAERGWAKASELLPHKDLIRRSVLASLQRRKYTSVVRSLKTLVSQSSADERDLKALAFALVQLGDHAEAAVYLRQLVSLATHDSEYRIGLAQCLARSADLVAAIEVLIPICEGDAAPEDALLLQSELLALNGNPAEALRLLERIAADHWDDPRFLLSYMHRAYAAREERLANRAFVRLIALRSDGKVTSQLMREGTLEELLQQEDAYRDQRETLQEAVASGRMPWLFAEDLLANSPRWAWLLHTQTLRWTSEERQARAAFGIYATNSFAVRTRGEITQIEPIAVPRPLGRIVIDLSALLTLHELGRLRDVAECVEKIIIPATYGDLRLRLDAAFQQRQPSREAELISIRAHIEGGKIRVTADERGLVRVDEYSEESEIHSYTIRDLIHVLDVSRQLPPAVLSEFEVGRYKPSGVDEQHPILELGDRLLIELETLRVLAKRGALDAVVDAFDVHLGEQQRWTVQAELNAHEQRREAMRSHVALWNSITELRSERLLEMMPVPRTHITDDESDEDEVQRSSELLESVALASSRGLVLVADDRVLHLLRHQADSSASTMAISSDQLLLALAELNGLTTEQVAADFRRMIKWRYRFLVPTAAIIRQWAKEAPPPSDALLDCAAYLHDCLRDPGLHCGFEASDPPMPLALKFVTAWIDAIGTALADIWDDGDFSEENAAALSQWVGEELAPSCPRGLWWHPVGLNLTRGVANGLFEMAIVRFALNTDVERANVGLRSLARSLGFDDYRLLTSTVNAVTAVKSAVSADARDESDDMFCRRMLQAALFHHADGGIDPFHFYALQEQGFLETAMLPEFPGLLSALSDANDPNRLAAPPGPNVFLKRDDSVSVLLIVDLLLHPDTAIRNAVRRTLEGAASTPGGWLSPRSCSLIHDLGSEICSTEIDRWRSVGLRLTAALRDDVVLHLAGLRQSIAVRYKEGVRRHLPKVLEPDFDLLVHFTPPLSSPIEQADDVRAKLGEWANADSVETALNSYVAEVGYVPLSTEFGPGELVRQWLSLHPGQTVGWDDLRAWAQQAESPVSQYHAVTVAMEIAAANSSSATEEVWNLVADIVGVSESPTDESVLHSRWKFYCELGGHYVRHIESLHPGQDGVRTACYAWWLASQACEMIVAAGGVGGAEIQSEVASAFDASGGRWLIARSSVIPSPMRYCSMYMTSTWAMSLLARLGVALGSTRIGDASEDVRNTIGSALRGYLIASPLADEPSGERCFAFQQNASIQELCDEVLPDAERDAFRQLIEFRRTIDVEKLKARLETLGTDALVDQQLTVLVAKDAIFAGTAFDDAIGTWLQSAELVAKQLLMVDESVLEHLLETLSEFYQRQQGDWAIRLPHLLAYTIEVGEDEARITRLFMCMMFMCVNGGVASPIERVLLSQWRANLIRALRPWRENAVNLAYGSEPWVSCRVRATSAVISRQIGPRLNIAQSAN